MTRIKAWQVNVVGAVLALGIGVWSARTGTATLDSLIADFVLLVVAIAGIAAIVPSTVMLLFGKLERVAAVLNVLVAVAMVVFSSPATLTLGGFLVVAAALGWREADG